MNYCFNIFIKCDNIKKTKIEQKSSINPFENFNKNKNENILNINNESLNIKNFFTELFSIVIFFLLINLIITLYACFQIEQDRSKINSKIQKIQELGTKNHKNICLIMIFVFLLLIRLNDFLLQNCFLTNLKKLVREKFLLFLIFIFNCIFLFILTLFLNIKLITSKSSNLINVKQCLSFNLIAYVILLIIIFITLNLSKLIQIICVMMFIIFVIISYFYIDEKIEI